MAPSLQLGEYKTMKHESMKHDASVTKAAFAALLDCPRGTVSRLCRRGMPVRSDGAVNTGEALRWVANLTSGIGGGWTGGQRGKLSLCDRAKSLLDGKRVPKPQPKRKPFTERGKTSASREIVASREGLLDYIRAHAAVRLPIVARELGLREYVARDAANVFDALLAGCGADDLMPDYAWPEFDDGGEPLTPELEKLADAVLEQITAICNDLRAAEGDTNPNGAH